MTFFRGRLGLSTAFWLPIALALSLAVLVYWPGLSGAFLFDDFSNLPTLGDFGPIDNWPAFGRYITSGTADLTGRPLALLSFLIDARGWPADPYPFKRTSLILHLLNGLLLALLLRRLGRTLLGESRRTAIAAALGAALWLLHPLLVSTTLYIVQREAMLPATFTLLGLTGWCKGRELAVAGRSSGLWLCAIAIAGCTLLGVASKANGALLPLLCWLVDAIVLAPTQPFADARMRHRFMQMRRVVLILPSLAVLGYLLQQGVHFAIHGIPSFRSWTLGERLLTESRVVCDYLAMLWLPHPYTAGIFNDAFVVSTGWLTPPSTLAAIAFLTALLAGAVALRARAPAAALAILFYFAGQLIESTVLPLELYFEHRNYMAAMLMFWPLALWLCGSGPAMSARRALIVALPLLVAGMTYLRADLWGDVRQQAEMWAEKNPDSPRAQAYAAQVERSNGLAVRAVARLRAVPVKPDSDLQVALNLIGAECDLGIVAPTDIARAAAALRQARITAHLGYTWFSEAIERLKSGDSCAGLDAEAIRRLLDDAAANADHGIPGRAQDNLSLRGTLALAQNDPDAALSYFKQAVDANPDPNVGLQQAAQLGAAGHPALGLAELDHLEKVWQPDAVSVAWSMAGMHAWLLRRQGYWQSEILHLRKTLQEDMRTTEPATRLTTP